MSSQSRGKALYIHPPLTGPRPIHVPDVFELESLETVKSKKLAPAFCAAGQMLNAFRWRQNVASSVNLAPP